MINKNFDVKYRSVDGFYTMMQAERDQNSTKYGQIEVSVRYSGGGTNYFTGEVQPRGYRVACSPVDRSETGTSRTLLGGNWESGLSFFIKGADRYNAKELQRIANDLDFEQLAKMYANGEKNSIFALVNKEAPKIEQVEVPKNAENKLLPAHILKKFEKVGTQTDKTLGEMEIVAKYFNPTGAGTWYATAYDPKNKIFSGYVSIFGDHNDEYGDFSLAELQEYKGRMGLPIELDRHFSGKLLKDVMTN